MSTRRKRTPEEIAASLANAQSTLATAKKNEEFAKINSGRNSIYAVAVLMAINGGIDYAMSKVPEVFYFYGPVIIIYVLLGIYFYRNPVLISIIALCLFILLHVFFAILDPTNIAKGVIIKILVISALISAIKQARKYKEELEKMNRPKNSDVLDEEFIG